MRKKLTGLLAVLSCILLLSACGSTAAVQQEEIDEETRNALFSLTETTVQQMDEVVTSGLVEEQKSNAAIYAGLQGWESAKAEIGAVDFSADADGNGVADCFEEKSITFDENGNYIVTVGVTGQNKSADYVVTYNDDITDYVSFATNVNYSFSELMEQAGMNTLLGMGTTFAVLILLSLIIALFGSILKAREKKKTEERLRREEEEEKKQLAQGAPIPLKDSSSGARDTAQPEGDELIAVLTAAVAAHESACDGQLAAVIGAAVAAYGGQGEPDLPSDPDTFFVRRVRRTRRK